MKRPLITHKHGTARIYCTPGSPRPGRYANLDGRDPLPPNVIRVKSEGIAACGCVCRSRGCHLCRGTECVGSQRG